MRISVVIPAYNEERSIVSSLREIVKYLSEKQFDFEILVVDDGSRDRTAELVTKMHNKRIRLIRNGRNRGKGYSVKNGVLRARKEYILFSDADLSTPIGELAKMIPHIRKHHVVIGSRRMEQSKIVVKQPWYRRIPGQVFPVIVNFLILRGIKDTQCGFKLFQRDVAHKLFKKQTLDGFSFDAEILYVARKHGYRIKEVPVVWINDLDSKLHPIRDSYRMFMELLRVKHNDLKGLYS